MLDAPIVKAQGTALVFRVVPDALTVEVGQMFSVNITFEGIPATPGAVGFEFNLSWDGSILQGVSMQEVEFHTVTPQAEWDNIWSISLGVSNSSVFYACTWLDTERAFNDGYAPISGNGTLAIITLKSIGIGQTTLHFELAEAGDPPGNPIPNVTIDGSVAVVHPLRVPEDYSSVQAAVNAAAPGSTIIIAPGVYNESVVANKTLTIVGKLGSEPIFSGGGSGIAVTLLPGASGSVITGIMITSWDKGILINNASGCKIQDNVMSLMNEDGIVLQGNSAANNNITRNVFQNSTVAIDLNSFSYNNTVCKNIIVSNGLGVKFESGGTLVYANTVAENGIGVSLSNTGSNLIYHNNFVNNTVQASIPTSTSNTWDNGYPSGGNYWSDYNGTDANYDGIGDTPYAVDQNSADRYPLIQPFNAHDVGITDYAVAKTVVGQGYLLRVKLKILNYGVNDESFLATANANASTVAMQAVALTKCSYIIIALTWNTSSYNHGYYSINTYAWPVQGENDTANNNCTMGSVLVTVPGDINGDFTVDIYDAITLAGGFNTLPGNLHWNANADINGDNPVDIFDAIILAGHFNQHYP